MRNLDRLTNYQLLNIQGMPRFFAIIVLLCCAAEICWAGDAPPAWVNYVDTNAMEKVFLDCTNNMAGVTSVLSALRTAGGFGAQQKMKWCAAKQQMVRTISPDDAH